MYTLIKAFGKPQGTSKRWVEIELGNLPINIAYKTFEKMYAVLSNPFLTNEVSLDLDLVRSQIGGLTITFNQFLVSNGNNALPTDDVIPEIKTKYIQYSDAFRAGYKVTPTDPETHPDLPISSTEKDWLFLSHPEVDFEVFCKRAMVSINGYFHFVTGNKEGAWIVDGMKSNHVSHENQIGILSFDRIGDLEYIQIKPEMVYKQSDEQALKNKAYIDIGQDVTNKTIILVIAGVMHLLNPRAFFRVGETSIAIDFNNLPILERYHESRNYLDYSQLPFDRVDFNPSLIAQDDFFSDENLTAYLTMSQSFIVLLDNNDLFIEKEPIRKSPWPMVMTAYKEPKSLMIGSHGRVLDYWTQPEDNQWAVLVMDNYKRERTYNTTKKKEVAVASDVCYPYLPFTYEYGTLYHIGYDAIKN